MEVGNVQRLARAFAFVNYPLSLRPASCPAPPNKVPRSCRAGKSGLAPGPCVQLSGARSYVGHRKNDTSPIIPCMSATQAKPDSLPQPWRRRAERPKSSVGTCVSVTAQGHQPKETRDESPPRRTIKGERGGGEGGIRTHGWLSPSTVFETAAFDHSATSPRHGSP
jgi:hypothetical protein